MIETTTKYECELDEIKEKFCQHVMSLQDKITQELSRVDPSIQLIEDNWTRQDFNGTEGGGGRTRAFTGSIIENAGVNFSKVYGAIDPKFSDVAQGEGSTMWAAGISLIIHPRNPKVPTVHANFRLIHKGDKFWFGGGADLTPFYPAEDDFKYFHDIWKKACRPFSCYDTMKKTCDEYFVNTHRANEMRGIGGIFFDHFNSGKIKMIS